MAERASSALTPLLPPALHAQVAAQPTQPGGVPSLPTFFDAAVASTGVGQEGKACYCIG